MSGQGRPVPDVQPVNKSDLVAGRDPQLDCQENPLVAWFKTSAKVCVFLSHLI